MGRWEMGPTAEAAGWMFSVGKKVEVSFDRESSRDVWFPATVLKTSGNSTFLVEYQQQGAGDEVIVHEVTVDYHHIRPSPPHLRDKKFVLLEKVDAYYDFGWWCGVITKELADNRYNIFFKHTQEEQEFTYSKVRPHMEWKRGKWFNMSQGNAAGRTSHSLIDNQIEQATPIIGKQSDSPMETSIRTRKRQTNLDNNEKTSTDDKIMNDDSSKKKEHPSVGQSEGFVSEVSEMTDHTFSKIKNLSHGKEVHSKQGKNIELKTPTTDSSKKRGRLTNELKSLQALMKGSEVDLVKRRTQEIVEKKDTTKDFLFVVMGLQCNRMTTSQGNMKRPAKKIPSVSRDGSEGGAASVSLRRKRGRPPKLQALSPKTPVTDSQDASKEKTDGSLEKESTSEASIGKSLETKSNDQPISRLFEGKHSSMDGPEGTVEQTSTASEGLLVSGSLPFIRSKALWETLESMEAFRMFPQKPHFRPLLEGVRDGAREGLAIGTMVTFSTVVDKTCSLRFDDPRSTIEDCLESLVELENNGFDVEVIRERLTGLLLIKDKQVKLEERSKEAVEKIEERNIQGKKTEKEIEAISRQIRELEEKRKQTLLKKEKRMREIGVMETVIEGIEQEIREVGAEFSELAAAPLMV